MTHIDELIASLTTSIVQHQRAGKPQVEIAATTQLRDKLCEVKAMKRLCTSRVIFIVHHDGSCSFFEDDRLTGV